MARHSRQIALAFDERADRSSASLRGGKGSGLARMHALGLPVPPGFTVTTTVARAYQEHQCYPKRLKGQIDRQLERLERKTGKKFGDPQNPLLLSVRSGSEVSMPGMMDTVLNLGMTSDVCDSLAQTAGASFTDACYSRFRTQMQDSFSNDPHEQLWNAIDAVFASWQSERAVAYRAAHAIPETLGTAITVQVMVFGNRDERSGTGVVFSRDPNTGRPGMYGEFLPCAQGEDVVSGSHTPMPISKLEEWNAALYQELADHVRLLEDELDAIVDVEFTIESGVLYLLQCRKAKLTPAAAVTFAVHRQWERRWSKDQVFEETSTIDVDSLAPCARFTDEAVAIANKQKRHLGHGIAASPGAVSGHRATSLEEARRIKGEGLKVILVRPDTNPNDLPAMLLADAIVTLSGGATSHAAVVARQLGIPAVVGFAYTATLVTRALAGPGLSVCGSSGNVYAGRVKTEEAVSTKEVNIFRKWKTLTNPRINFDAVREYFNVSSILVDVYLSEAMAHAARGTDLASEASALAQRIRLEAAEWFACYLAIAVASELRHFKEGMPNSEKPGYADTMHFLRSCNVSGGGHGRGDEAILSYLKPRTIAEHAAFFSGAETTFRSFAWSEGYGGEKWADIAQAGHAFLSGEWPHGLFVDRMFDLEHNGGHIFDKHCMVHSQSYLNDLLNIKKAAESIDDLAAGFMGRSAGRSLTWQSFWQSFCPCAEVFSLWGKGTQLRLWRKEIE